MQQSVKREICIFKCLYLIIIKSEINDLCLYHREEKNLQIKPKICKRKVVLIVEISRLEKRQQKGNIMNTFKSVNSETTMRD